MSAPLKIILTWLVLLFLTLLTSTLSNLLPDAQTSALCIIVIAGIKIYFVFSQFIEVKFHHQPWWSILHVWLFIVLSILIGGCLISVS